MQVVKIEIVEVIEPVKKLCIAVSLDEKGGCSVGESQMGQFLYSWLKIMEEQVNIGLHHKTVEQRLNEMMQ